MVSRDRESRGGVLITGASAGIGLELARRAAADGWDLALTARNLAALEVVAGDVGQKHGVRTVVVPADLADLTGPARVQEELHRADFAVDFLVNNAGFGTWGPFVEQSLESQLSMLQVNAVALTELTHRFLAGMRERGRGRILNVASTAAFQPGPDMAVYFASKAYVLHFSEALAHELRGTGITVTTLCPGPTETEFQDRAGMTDTRVGANPLMMDVGPVAEAGYQAAMVGRSIAVPGVANRVGSLLPRFIPRRLVRAATAFINSPR